MEKLTVISTFAGCGGSSLGYKQAGYKELLVVEWDDKAVGTFKENFPGVPVYHGDIKDLSGEQCLKLAGIKKGELDVLDGSPPCQGFSMVPRKLKESRRKVKDDRNDLFREFARLLKEMQPKAFVMENVTGMVKGAMKQIFIECLAVLRGCGYQVKAEVMNAMYYGTPQSRQRVIFIGIRNDLKVKPSHPKPQTAPIKLKDCIWDLRNIKSPDDRPLDDVVKRMAPYQPKKWASDTKIFKAIKGNLAGSIGLLWGVWDRVCGTIVASEISIVGIVHPDRKRYLSLLELKRVGGFPEDFKFKNRTEGRKQIGNCVPPPLMKAIAEHIKQLISQPVEK